MKTAMVVAVALACLAPGLGLAASLTGSNVVSSATVNLSSVGMLDWARWPGYTHKSTTDLERHDDGERWRPTRAIRGSSATGAA